MNKQSKILILLLAIGILITYSTSTFKRSHADIHRQIGSMLALQMQAECLRENDISCALKANEILSSFTAQALDDSALLLLDEDLKKDIAEFISKTKSHGGTL